MHGKYKMKSVSSRNLSTREKNKQVHRKAELATQNINIGSSCIRNLKEGKEQAGLAVVDRFLKEYRKWGFEA